MKLRKFGFLKHHRKIKIEGTDLPKIINKCINDNLLLKDVKWKSPVESTSWVKDEDFRRLIEMAGYSYKITSMKEGGILPFLTKMRKNIAIIIGAFLIGALIFYQSLFVAEIRVYGYTSITEADIRKTLEEAGLYEGAKKPEDYKSVKGALYENHREITWVSIYEEGRLIKVKIAEAGKGQMAKKEDVTPVDIVATRSGFVEKIIPLKGNAVVEKGDYVNKGDVLISGTYTYQSSNYARGDDFFNMYSHSQGYVYAKVPRQLTFYIEKKEQIKRKGNGIIPGVYVRIGDTKIDTTRPFNRYKTSVKDELKVVDIGKPLPFVLSFVAVKKVEVVEIPMSTKELDELVDAAVRQYKREKMTAGEEIISTKTEYSESENLIIASVFMEVLQDIGADKEIKVKKEEKEEEKMQ